MEKLKISYDRTGNTITVWFGEPLREFVSVETGDEAILMKDKDGRVFGCEELNYSQHAAEPLKVAFEAVEI